MKCLAWKGMNMATILSEDELRKIVAEAQYMENGTEENVEG